MQGDVNANQHFLCNTNKDKLQWMQSLLENYQENEELAVVFSSLFVNDNSNHLVIDIDIVLVYNIKHNIWYL